VARSTKIVVEPKSGQIHDITVLVADRAVIQKDGTRKRTWSADIPDRPVKVKVYLVGVTGSRAEVTVDLPGTEHDFSVVYTLTSSVLILEFSL
jgi:hypothetical protein